MVLWNLIYILSLIASLIYLISELFFGKEKVTLKSIASDVKEHWKPFLLA